MSALLTRTLYFAERLAPVPTVPFGHLPMLRAIKDCLSEMAIPTDDMAQDDYCLYVRVRRGSAPHQTIIDSHIDHPGFLINSDGNGIAFGSVGQQRVRRLLEAGPLPLRLFAPDGTALGMGQLTDMRGFNVTVAADFTLPANTLGLWDTVDFQVDGEDLLMYAADNMIATDVMLAVLEAVVQQPSVYRDIDVLFVFAFLEEVFEVSSTAMVMRGTTPFGRIAPDAHVYVLESMQSTPLRAGEGVQGGDLVQARLDDDAAAYAEGAHTARDGQQFHPLYASMGLRLPNHEDGLFIKVNDSDGPYGYLFDSSANGAESRALVAARQLEVPHQHSLSGGACNGTAYTLFPVTPHIVTLSIPNPYKHNIALDGSVVPERIKLRDIEAQALVLSHVLAHPALPDAPADSLLSPRLRQTALTPTPAAHQQKQAERGTIAWSAKWRLARGRYFGTSSAENVLFRARGAAGRLRQQIKRRF